MIIDFLDETKIGRGLGMLTSSSIRIKNNRFVNILFEIFLKLPSIFYSTLNLINQKAFVKSFLHICKESNGPRKKIKTLCFRICQSTFWHFSKFISAQQQSKPFYIRCFFTLIIITFSAPKRIENIKLYNTNSFGHFIK